MLQTGVLWMKSITLHGISEDLDRRIVEKCRETGLSQNKTVIQALENALLPSTGKEKGGAYAFSGRMD
jgi:hypothetical protein